MANLVFYNTLSRSKEAFAPLEAKNVRMYVCGPTVYDRAHIGNARPVIVFDTLFRLLRHLYGADHVTYVRNITDIDDKIIDAARANGESIDSLTARTTKDFHADMAALNTLSPTHEPRATQHVPGMIAMIGRLIDSGHAYAEQGHVLFSVPAMADYGKLSRRDRDEMIAGARVEVAPYKKDAADFVLWKPSRDDQPGWDSPWGRGRPGWHLECSVMSEAHLGETFDIHGGGIDLIFPHHENEIAQSVCAHHGKPFVRVWMHNGFLMVEGEKMSKSLGNFFTVRDVLAKAPGEAIRLAMLATHYRQPIDWTAAGLEQAKTALERFYGALRGVADLSVDGDVTPPAGFMDALLDDLNTPLALSQLHEEAGALNKAGDEKTRRRHKGALLAAGALLGLLQQDPEAWFKKGAGVAGGLAEEEIERLIAARLAARKARNFAEADRIRDELQKAGIVLEDRADKTLWRRAG